jgi:uncharacterized membrane protein
MRLGASWRAVCGERESHNSDNIRAVPNWLYILVGGLYYLGLALWIGGAVALGAIAAPALFRALPRHQAGAIFGPTLRRFARLRVIALLLIVAASIAKRMLWETHAATPWLILRWAAIAVMAVELVYEIGYQERAMDRLRLQLAPEVAEDDPRRLAFGRLHKRAEALLRASVLAALLALFLS